MNVAQVIRMMVESNLPHADELADGLESGALRVVEDQNLGPETSCDELLGLYRMRSERKRDGIPSDHSLRMNKEAKQLADRLALFSGKRCHIVIVEGAPNISYAIFVLADGSAVIGCTWGLDARKTPAAEWKRLWEGGTKA